MHSYNSLVLSINNTLMLFTMQIQGNFFLRGKRKNRAVSFDSIMDSKCDGIRVFLILLLHFAANVKIFMQKSHLYSYLQMCSNLHAIKAGVIALEKSTQSEFRVFMPKKALPTLAVFFLL